MDIKTSSREEDKSEHEGGGKSEKSLRNIPGCDFISYGVNELERQDHFQIDHRDFDLTEDTFILINSAMA